MQRRDFLKFLSLTSLPAITSCAYWRIDLKNVLLRSDVIDSFEKEKLVLSKAKLGQTSDGRIRVLFCRGTAYERGYQHGVLLRKEIQDNIGYLYERALGVFHTEELFAETYERMRPFISQDYIDEMHGLAHGSKMSLSTIHHVHVLADMGEWGGKKKLKGVIKEMMAGKFATTCSNLGVNANATADGKLYTVRVLDWGLHKVSKLHQYPLIVVGVPDQGIAYANIGWIGYLGAISGLNARGITLGEMGYGDPGNETLRGIPMPFLLRDILTHASNLQDVRKIIGESVGTNSYVFLMSDGKTSETELYVKDRDRFLVAKPGTEVHDGQENMPAIENTCYGGRYDEKMAELLKANHGQLSPEYFMNSFIPQIAMKSNFQNVIYDPQALKFWVTNAKNKDEWAASQPYTFFDFGQALEEFMRNSSISPGKRGKMHLGKS